MKVFPAEWEKHSSTWLAWPAAADLWGEDLPGAQKEFAALAKEIAKSETVDLLSADGTAEEQARAAFKDIPNIRYHEIPYGDIWLRDIGCIFTRAFSGPQKLLSQVFNFNGWGGKYMLEGDQDCALEMAKASNHGMVLNDFIFEGGSIENDGEGNCLTTEECLLNSNRNPSMRKSEIEKELKRIFGFEKVLWLKKGLKFDHTDGHIDNAARFIAPGSMVCMTTNDSKHPQFDSLKQIHEELKAMRDLNSVPFKIATIPAPSAEIKDRDGNLFPASYLNFVFTSKALIVPTYNCATDFQALEILQSLMPKLKVVGLPSTKILLGGGSFHCISQQEPAA